MIDRISIITGIGKSGIHEPVERIDMHMGDIVSIVGPTGSGKTTLINDIELFANYDTPTKRCILINGSPPPEEFRCNPVNNPIALITQHTSFLSDLPVKEFLSIHAKIRSKDKNQIESLVVQTIDFANKLTGEPVILSSKMTELSGGQTRALLIADAMVICNTPIVLLDEVENAGINRIRALELLKQYRKIFVFVTHDPNIALISDYRIVMKDGCIVKVIYSNEEERIFAHKVARIDNLLSTLREQIRYGESLNLNLLEGLK